MTHEIGHMFGIKHCQWLNCVMQGSNHLEESDRRPLDFCPICLRKTQSAVGFKIAERYKVQTAFHRRRNLNLKLYLLVFKSVLCYAVSYISSTFLLGTGSSVLRAITINY